MGYGGSKPIVEEKTEEDRRLNRRVEFEVTKKDKQ
jgi:outer membrane protein OmpA-like peptidoglycan-associated protein